MKSFSDVNEMARKNPDRNPRITSYQYLIDNGYNTSDYFFSFTKLKKVGINPSSRYDTPNGIYCFPAVEIFKIVNGDMNNVPYVNDAPYIHVLKKKGGGIIDPIETYSRSDYQKDMDKLLKYITKPIKGHLPINNVGKREIKDIMDDGKRLSTKQNPFGWLWNTTRLLSLDNEIANRMGWKGAKKIDGYKDWYSEIDKWQFDKKTHKKIRKHKNKRKGKFKERYGVKYSSQGWNNLLRLLGYNGFVDRSGSGTIHSNEPTQAMFLSSKSFDVVDMVENKSYELLYRQQGIDDTIKKLEDKHNTVIISGDLNKSALEGLNKLSNGDIRGCRIEYYMNIFNIFDGEMSNFDILGDIFHLNGVTLDSGNFYIMRYIKDCVITGGNYEDCEINSCEVISGKFHSCDFPDTNVINNSTLIKCKRLKNHMMFNCNFDSCRTYDCSFGSGCAVNDTLIFGDKKILLLDNNVAYMDCQFNNVSISNGLYKEFRIERSIIKNGEFNTGRISSSIIKGGDFKDTVFYETDFQGGNIIDG